MKIDIPHEPGESVWTFVLEPVYFEVKDVKTVRYIPGPVIEAEVRFVEIVLNKFQPHIKYNVKLNSGESYCDVFPEQVFTSQEQTEKARQETLSKPEYAWLKELE